MLRKVIEYLFRCTHAITTWPRRDDNGADYVVCLKCGRKMPYGKIEFGRAA